jgi:tape measure domain-containing protein
MALNGSIVITTKVDTTQAESDLKGLVVGIKTVEKEQVAAAKAAEEHALKMQRVADVSRTAAIGLGVFGAALGAAGIASIKLAADLEQSRVAFTTLLGSATKADAFLRDLAMFAAQTPFEFVGLQDSARRLLAFGFAAQDIIPLMNGIGNAVAGLGGGKEQIDRVTLALGQMQAKGKVSAEEMNQLAELGIPGWKMIASAIGISIPEAMKRAEKGAIDSTTAINALINGMNEKFPGMMEKQSKTINGVFSNLVDGATRTATLIGERLIRAFHVADIIGNAANIIAGFAATIENAGLVAAMDKLFPPGLQITIVAIAGALTASMIPALTGVATAFGTAVIAAGPFLIAGAAVGGLAYTIARNWEGLTKFFSGLFSGIATLVGKLVENIRKPFVAVIEWIRGKLQSLLEIVSGVLDRVGGLVPAPVKQALGNALTFIKSKADDVKDAIGGAVQGVITLGGKAVTAAGSGIRAMGSLITPDVKALIDASKTGKISTTFKGLSGGAAAPAAPGAAGRAKAGAKAAGPARAGGAAEEPVGAFVSMEEFNQHYRDIDRKEQELADTRKRLQSETADQLMQVYTATTQLFAGDFTVVTTAIAGEFKQKIINALSRSPEITNALGDLGSALTGPLGIAVMFGSLLVGSVMRAADEAKKISKEVTDNAIAIDRLINPDKYKNENPRFNVIQTALTQAEEIAQKAEDAVMDFTKSPAGLVMALTGGAIGGDTFKTLRDAASQAATNVRTLRGELERTPRTLPTPIPTPTPTPTPPPGFGILEQAFESANKFMNNKDKAEKQVLFAEAFTRFKSGDIKGAADLLPGIGITGDETGPVLAMFQQIIDKMSKPDEKPAVMPGETPDRPIYTQVVNVRDFREAFPDSAYFRAPSVDTTRSLNANAVAYR